MLLYNCQHAHVHVCSATGNALLLCNFSMDMRTCAGHCGEIAQCPATLPAAAFEVRCGEAAAAKEGACHTVCSTHAAHGTHITHVTVRNVTCCHRGPHLSCVMTAASSAPRLVAQDLKPKAFNRIKDQALFTAGALLNKHGSITPDSLLICSCCWSGYSCSA